MTGWRQAVFIRQRRIDVIQRALSKILDEESWSPATPRRLRVGSADASSRGWTMIVPELANFFLDRGGTGAPRLCRLARELHCPAYEVDVRASGATTLCEVDPHGRTRISGAPIQVLAALAARPDGDGDGDDDNDDNDGARFPAVELAGKQVGFGLFSVAGDSRDRVDAVDPGALADHLGALAGFPAWTRHGDDAVAAGELVELVYAPPRIIAGTHGLAHAYAIAGLTARPLETRAAIARSTPRAVLPAHDRRGRRPRSASRPRR
jgi:hypothetical protein